jgi:hypothetical protein
LLVFLTLFAKGDFPPWMLVKPLENFRFLKSKIEQFTRRTDVDAGIRALVFRSAGVSWVSRPAWEARKETFRWLREAWNCYGKDSVV